MSAPYVNSDGDYVPISDTDSRFYADRWVVRGYNNGDTEQIVRAWALCAAASQLIHPRGGRPAGAAPSCCPHPLPTRDIWVAFGPAAPPASAVCWVVRGRSGVPQRREALRWQL